MILMISLAVAVVLLAILIFALPLGMSLKGKTVIWLTSVFVGSLGIASANVLPFWEVILFPLLLSILFAYVLSKKQGIQIEQEKSNFVEGIQPIFSYNEQLEKAKLAETIDEYYVTVKDPSNQTAKVDSPIIETASIETPAVEISMMDEPSNEISTVDLSMIEELSKETSMDPSIIEEPSIEPKVEAPIFEPEELTSIDYEAVHMDGKIINEDKDVEHIPVFIEEVPQLESIYQDLELVDFDERARHLMDENFNQKVEQSIASAIESEEEVLMENRRRLFDAFDQEVPELVENNEKIDESLEFAERKIIAELEEMETGSELIDIEKSANEGEKVKLEELIDASELVNLEEQTEVERLEESEERSKLVSSEALEELNEIARPEELEEQSEQSKPKEPEERSEWLNQKS